MNESAPLDERDAQRPDWFRTLMREYSTPNFSAAAAALAQIFFCRKLRERLREPVAVCVGFGRRKDDFAVFCVFDEKRVGARFFQATRATRIRRRTRADFRKDICAAKFSRGLRRAAPPPTPRPIPEIRARRASTTARVLSGGFRLCRPRERRSVLRVSIPQLPLSRGRFFRPPKAS